MENMGLNGMDFLNKFFRQDLKDYSDLFPHNIRQNPCNYIHKET